MSTICSQPQILMESLKEEPAVYFFQNTTSHLIKVISIILSELIAETSQSFKTTASIFNCKTPPKISIKKYLERFEFYGRGSQECFILALIYMDRISEHNSQFVITPLNIHR